MPPKSSKTSATAPNSPPGVRRSARKHAGSEIDAAAAQPNKKVALGQEESASEGENEENEEESTSVKKTKAKKPKKTPVAKKGKGTTVAKSTKAEGKKAAADSVTLTEKILLKSGVPTAPPPRPIKESKDKGSAIEKAPVVSAAGEKEDKGSAIEIDSEKAPVISAGGKPFTRERVTEVPENQTESEDSEENTAKDKGKGRDLGSGNNTSNSETESSSDSHSTSDRNDSDSDDEDEDEDEDEEGDGEGEGDGDGDGEGEDEVDGDGDGDGEGEVDGDGDRDREGLIGEVEVEQDVEMQGVEKDIEMRGVEKDVEMRRADEEKTSEKLPAIGPTPAAPALTASLMNTIEETPDDDMEPTLDDLQGASRTIGGFARGNAQGNTYNWGDDQTTDVPALKSKGKVIVYVSGNDPATVKPSETVPSCQKNLPLHIMSRPLFKDLGNKWPVIKNPDYTIFVYDAIWTLLGSFTNITSVDGDEEITWQSENNKPVLYILLSNFTLPGLLSANVTTPATSGLSTARGVSVAATTQSVQSAASVQPQKLGKPPKRPLTAELLQLAMLLGIPTSLHSTGDGLSLQENYKRYLAWLDAEAKYKKMLKDKTWPDTISRPGSTDIRRVFIGKSTWHDSWSKTFPHLTSFPEMQKWLNDDDDCLNDLDLWGVDRTNYHFKDLIKWIEKGGTLSKKKRKVAVSVPAAPGPSKSTAKTSKTSGSSGGKTTKASGSSGGSKKATSSRRK